MSKARHPPVAAAPAPVGEVAASVAVPAVPQVDIAPPLPPLTRGEVAGLAIAATLHAMLLGLVVAERLTRAGGGGTQDEIVTIDIVETAPGTRLTIGDLLQADRDRGAPQDGTFDPAPESAASKAAEPADATRPSAPPPLQLPDLDEPDGDAPRAVVAPRAGEGAAPDGERPASEAAAAPGEAESAASAAADVGGGLRGTDTTDLPGVAVAMASGPALDYARQVLETLARGRPRVEPGNVGRVHFAFAVAGSGHSIGVRITRSSGNRRIDEAVLATVRDLRFPAPPAGLRGSDLIYETYFDFRPEKRS